MSEGLLWELEGHDRAPAEGACGHSCSQCYDLKRRAAARIRSLKQQLEFAEGNTKIQFEACMVAEQQLAAAREAVRQLIRMVAWDSADGGDVQDWAVKQGILIAVEVTEPCNPDNCVCAEVGFPVTCYRFSPAYRANLEGK